MKKLFNNKPNVVVAIVIFVLLFGWLVVSEAKAEGTFELGPTWLSGFDNNGYGFVYTERVAEKWDLGLHLISEQDFYNTVIPNNGGFFVQRVVCKGNFCMGLGATRWINTSRLIGSEFTFGLMVGYQFNDQWGVRIRHWSNAGTKKPNRGQDLLTLTYTFGE